MNLNADVCERDSDAVDRVYTPMERIQFSRTNGSRSNFVQSAETL
jgi:hypothetical protein